MRQEGLCSCGRVSLQAVAEGLRGRGFCVLGIKPRRPWTRGARRQGEARWSYVDSQGKIFFVTYAVEQTLFLTDLKPRC